MRMHQLGWLAAAALALGGCSEDFTEFPAVGGSGTTTSHGGAGGSSGGGGSAGAGGGSNCPAGSADCDQDAAHDCETDTTDDAANCGACGHDCLGGTCQASACTAVMLGDPLGTGGPFHNGFLTLDATHVYFGYMGVTSGGIAVAPKDGSSAAVCLACDVGVPRDLATDGSFVYWTDNWPTPDEVRRLSVGGGTFTTLWTGTLAGGAPTPVAIDQSSVYWYDGAGQQVMRAALGGSSPTAVAPSATPVLSIQSDGGWLFWTNSTDVLGKELASANNPVQLATGRPEPKSLGVDATHVYWAEGHWNQPDNAVQRVARGGGTVELVATHGVASIAIDATDVYAACGATGEIWRAPKGGGNPTILDGNAPNAWDTAVDSDAVYWTSESTGQVFKLAK